MKKLFQMFIILIAICVTFFGGIAIRLVLLNKQIDSLEYTCEMKQNFVDELIAQTFRTDEQSIQDKKYMETVLIKIFTFYSIEEFNEARDIAVNCGLPNDFINCFYDQSELSGIYAENMLDVICKFESADFYLLDRNEDIGYYYANIKLNTVKYSGSNIELGFFIALYSTGPNAGNFASIVYYNIE